MKFLSLLVCIAAMAQLSMAFTLSSSTSRTGYAGITTLKMGFFDGIMKAFDNEEVR